MMMGSEERGSCGGHTNTIVGLQVIVIGFARGS